MDKMTFNDFLITIKQGIDNGEIEISQPVSKLDMAIQFAVGRIGDRKGIPCGISLEELYSEILTFTDKTIFEENEGWFYE